MRIILLWSSSTTTKVAVPTSTDTCHNEEDEDESSVEFNDMCGLFSQAGGENGKKEKEEYFEHKL